MLTLSIDVNMTDGASGTYAVTPRVQVDFEREFDTSIISAFNDEPKLAHLYWLGWRSMKFAKATDLDFDQWLDRVAAVAPEGLDDVPLDETA